jgi:hypothetical protein
MSRRRSTAQILKERLSVLLVIVACMGVVVIFQEARGFFVPPRRLATATPVAAAPTPTAPAEAPATQATPQPAPGVAGNRAPTPASAPAKPASFSGKWEGSFAETVDGTSYQYRYTLELSQQGGFVAGKSTIASEADPDALARFVVKGQVVESEAGVILKISETLLAAQKLRGGSAVGPRNTQLSYGVAEAQEVLEGEWVDSRPGAQKASGVVRLIKQ